MGPAVCHGAGCLHWGCMFVVGSGVCIGVRCLHWGQVCAEGVVGQLPLGLQLLEMDCGSCGAC